MEYKYSVQPEEGTARAVGLSLPISLKRACEICDFIKGKNVDKAIASLTRVMNEEEAVPFKRFNRGGVGHKPGMAAGRYPIKTCSYIISVLKDVKANAEHKGLNPSILVVFHMSAKKASKSYHYGRKRRRLMKRTHLEVMVKEKQGKKQ